MRFRRYFVLLAWLWPGVLLAAGPAISGISDNGPVARYEKLEVSFNLGNTYSNPYDPAQINAQVTFSGPGGVSTTVNAFWYQAYTRSGSISGETLTPAGPPQWKARFAPALTGSWTYQVSATDAGGSSSASGPGPVTVQPSAKHGFIHVSPSDPRYFRYDDGTVYVPLGEDMAWAGAGRSYQYDQWLNALAAGGGNFVRVWMAAWGMCVDWDQSTHSQAYLGDYDNHQGDLWDLDHVMDTADTNGEAVMLCLIHHGEFSSTTNPNWPDNIMSSVWGGPLTAPDQVWTNATAQALMMRRWRYLVARYAYSTALQSWELWNEMNWTDNFDASHTADAAAWHQMMRNDIRAQDPYQHIITTSFADGMGANYNLTWNAGMDVVQTHEYGATDWAQWASDTTAAYRAAYPSKPFHLGEFGLVDDATSVAQDPSGSSIAETAWGALMSGAASGGACWWWDGWVPNQNLYYRWKGISSFLAGEDLDQRSYVALRPSVATATRSDISVTPAFNNGSPWGSPSPASSFSLAPTGTLSPSAASLGTYLWGSWTAGKNPPSFVVNYATAGQFQVQVTNASTSGTTALTVTLDGGATALNNSPVSTGNTYSIAVPAGSHTIKVDGTGQDWIVPIYNFTNYGSLLRCYALTGTAKVLGWVQSRNDTYWNQCASCQGGTAKPLPTVSDGVVQLSGLSNDGNWNVGWYETLGGTLSSSGSAVCTGGALNLTVPAMSTDLAFKLTWAGAAASPTPTRTSLPTLTRSPTATPSPSGSPTSSLTATLSSTQTPSCTASATPSAMASASPSATAAADSPTPSATAAIGSPSSTATPGADSPTATGTVSPLASPSGTATPGAASPTATGTVSPLASPSSTATQGAASPTATGTVSPLASPSVTATPSGASPTPSPTQTPSLSASASPSATATPTASPTASISPSVSPTVTATESALPTGTPTATPTGIPAATLSPSPGGGGSGPLQVLGFMGVPDPDPKALALKLAAPADSATLSLWTPALVLIGRYQSGPLVGGWQSVPLPEALLRSIPRGLFFATVSLARGPQRSAAVPPISLINLQ